MKLALIFNGQGAHYAGMGMDFDRQFPQASAVYEQAEAVTGWPLREWIQQEPERFGQTRYAQVAITSTSLAIYRSIQDLLPPVSYMAGLSLGEYSALVASGALDQASAFALLQERGELMSRQCETLASDSPCQMAAVMGVPYEECQALVAQVADQEPLYIANINSSAQIIVAGTMAAVERFKEIAKAAGYKKVIPLKVEGPFHSPLMANAQEAMAQALEKVTFKQGDVPVISNTTLDLHQPESLSQVLVRHLVEPVYWKQTIDKLVEEGVTHLVQIGPGNTLAGLLKREGLPLKVQVLDKVEDLDALKNFLTEEE